MPAEAILLLVVGGLLIAAALIAVFGAASPLAAPALLAVGGPMFIVGTNPGRWRVVRSGVLRLEQGAPSADDAGGDTPSVATARSDPRGLD